MGDNIVRARLYIRVSTERQATEGYSLDAQQERLIAYCTSQGWEIAETYIDDGESAKSLKRPAVQRMIADCVEGDVILVYRLDRLTRSSKDIEYLIELAEQRRIYLKSATEDINTSTSSGRFHLRLIVQFGQYERETIAERASMGKRKRALTGAWQGGKAPFGYVAVDSNEVKNGRFLKRLEPDPMRSHLVTQIFDRYVSGEGTRSIARWLNDQHVTTYHGRAWSSTAVSRIISNPTYCGIVEYDRTGERVQTPSTSIPPLVSVEMFEQAQKIKGIRTNTAPRHATGLYPLTGVAVCGNCGTKLFGHKVSNGASSRTGRTWRGYTCANYRKGRFCGEKPLVTVSAQIVEDAVIEEIEAIVETTESFNRFFSKCIAEFEEHAGTSVSEIERLKHDLDEAQAAIQRWDDKYEKGRMDDDEHEEKTRPLKDRVRSLKAMLADIEEHTPVVPDRQAMEVAFRSVRSSWGGLTEPERKVLIQSFCDAAQVVIVVHPDRRIEIRPRLLV